MPASKTTELSRAVAAVSPATAPKRNLPPAQTVTPLSFTATVVGVPAGIKMLARAFAGMIVCRRYVNKRSVTEMDHAERTVPIGVSMEAFAQVKLLKLPGAG